MRLATDEEGYKENYFAFYLTIKHDKSVAQALMDMGLYSADQTDERDPGDYGRRKLTEEELEEIIELKVAGDSWEQIAEQYCMMAKTLFARVKRYMGPDWKDRPWR